MTDIALHPKPRTGVVVREQFRAVGAGLGREMAAGAALVLGLTVLIFLGIARNGWEGAVSMSPDNAGPVLGLIGLLAPVAAWKGEGPSSRGYFWSLPVAREPHTLVKVFCGWAWLMIVLAAFVGWVALQSWVTGGGPGVDEMRLVFADGAIPASARQGGPLDPALLREVRWVTPGWQWVVPFAAPTITYLFGTIAVLVADHPWRLLAVPFLAVGVLSVIADTADVQWLSGIGEKLMAGRYSLETLLTGSNEAAARFLTTAGDQALVWRNLAEAGQWFATAAIWGLPALAGVLLAAYRYQER
jgi:hypothetical protein